MINATRYRAALASGFLLITSVLAVASCAPRDRTFEAPTEEPPTQTSESAGFDVATAAAVFASDGTEMGTVAFRTSCESVEAVRLGIALLHHMTYVEAAETFEEIGSVEPTCALAPWGVAMSYVHPLWPDVPTADQLERGWELVREAAALGTASPRETAMIQALQAYYRDGNTRSERARLTTFREAWGEAAEAYPDDPEVALFHVLATIAVTAAVPERVEERLTAGLVAEQVMEAIPDHPGAHHYVIHAYDIPIAAEQALPVARRYGLVAPANSHALHMTSHIFTQRGLWEESIDYNQRRG